jgi:hypothetical protein
MAKRSSPADLAALPDEQLLEAVQRQTFRFFWEGAHPVSGLACRKMIWWPPADRDSV